MAMMERPEVRETTGGKCWEHTFERFALKVFVPDNSLDGQTNNYSFRAPLLLVFEEEKQSMEKAVKFAQETGLAKIAADHDCSVLFVYPTNETGWAGADATLYADLIAEIKLITVYQDGIVENHDFFSKTFKGYFVRGAIFRADIYSFGASADYVARHLLTTVQGEYLWGPGEITPAMCSMERLHVMPKPDRTDIAVMSIGNSQEVNQAFGECDHLLIKPKADYIRDYESFVKQFKMWCGHMELEPDFRELAVTEEAGFVTVRTSPDNRVIRDQAEHKVGYFAYYNNSLFDHGPAPLVLGFHGGGDSSMYLTYVAGWWEIAHRYGFLFVSVENHQAVTATEVMELLEGLKQRYPIDEHRIYATGFSMGSGKTWDLYQEYPDVFAGLMPASALFPVYTTFWGTPATDRLNRTVPVPVFYSGGEESPLPELPLHTATALERVQYVAEVNGLVKAADFKSLSFEEKAGWASPIWGVPGEHIEKIYDETRNSTLTVHRYDSADGVCRTAFASVSGQVHECRHHSCEQAWRFISQFSR